jgi:hypothetical protein
MLLARHQLVYIHKSLILQCLIVHVQPKQVTWQQVGGIAAKLGSYQCATSIEQTSTKYLIRLGNR